VPVTELLELSIDGLHRFRLAHHHGTVSYTAFALDVFPAPNEAQVWLGAQCGACGDTTRELVPVSPLRRASLRLANPSAGSECEQVFETLNDEEKLVDLMRTRPTDPTQN